MLRVFKIVLAGVVLYFILRAVDLKELWESVISQEPLYLFLSLLSVPVWILLKSLKWGVLLKAVDRRISFFDTVRSFLIGFSVGMITPGKVGELSRGLFVTSNKRYAVFGLVILDRYLDLLILLFLVPLGMFYFFGLVAAVLVSCAALVGAVALPVIQKLIPEKNKWVGSGRISSAISEGIRTVKMLSAVRISVAAILTLFVMMLSISTSYFLLSSHFRISFLDAVTVFPLVLFTNILPVTFANLGVRETATIFLLSTYGVRSEVSLSVALSLFFLHSLVPGILGALLLQVRNRRPESSQLRLKA